MEQSSPEYFIESLLTDPRLQFLTKYDLQIVIPRLGTFARLWDKWNRKISLTAEKEMALYIRNHFFVSFQFLKALGNPQGIVDIGSGAGLPGVPLKIIWPAIPMLLVESRRKRANFLKQVVRELSLENTVVMDSKVEDVGETPFQIDTALFRAVADTKTCLEMASGILQSEGRVILIRTLEEASKDSPHPEYSRIDAIDVEDFNSNPLLLECYKKHSNK
ncbi:MAG: 16S rRNA (guanine(527)-N(7))-methyltransferase RsmG [Candidatus Nitronauta litoralis]|uniref:Ribosomal RNA small subunit methyltransferase G n=1 Tax=Candidatus Nitronauta litoralis TaxID=2705533 RepID=A0A7T0BV25_9BACT|nr:MAG: 16S rRNA (guanine(527)-N(7))-methyltransferase RsmG [Candidatus Nitronauta litoralis]